MNVRRIFFRRIALFAFLVFMLLPSGQLSAQEADILQASPVAPEPTATVGDPDDSLATNAEQELSTAAINSIAVHPVLRSVVIGATSSLNFVYSGTADAGADEIMSFVTDVPAGLTNVSIQQSQCGATYDDGTRQVTGSYTISAGTTKSCSTSFFYTVPGDAVAGSKYYANTTATLGDDVQTNQGVIVAVSAAGDVAASVDVVPAIVGPGSVVVVEASVSGPTLSGANKPASLDVTVPAGWTVDTASMTAWCSGTCTIHPLAAPVYAGNVVSVSMLTSGFATGGALTVKFSATIPVDAQPGDSWMFDAAGTWNTVATSVVHDSVTYPAGTAEIELVTSDGSPLPVGTQVCIDQTNCQTLTVETPSGSTLTFPNLPVGDHVITFSAPGFPDATGSVNIVADQTTSTTLENLTPLPGTANIVITTIDNAPLPAGTTICLDATNCQTLDVETPSGSTVTFRNLPPGTYPVTVTAPGFADASGSVTVAPGETGTTTIENLTPLAGAVEITITTSDGNPFPSDTQVCLADQCDTAENLVAADLASGSVVTFADVAAGTYPITVTDADPYLDASATVTVTPGATATVTILLLQPDATVTPTTEATATTELTATTEATATTVSTTEPTATLASGNIPTRQPTATPTATASGSGGGSNAQTPAAGSDSGSGTVSALPSTGTGESGTNWLWLPGVLALLCLAFAATAIRKTHN